MAYIPTRSISLHFADDDWQSFVDENPSWRETLAELAQEGDGETAWKVYLGLSNSKYNKFLNIPDFFEEIEKARLLEQLYWEREARRMVAGDSKRIPGAGRGQAAVLKMVMKTKYNWDQDDAKNSVKSLPSDPIQSDIIEYTPEELEEELAARGLPISILDNYSPEPIDYSKQGDIDGEFTEVV